MTKQELAELSNEAWLGRLQILKPKKNENIGVPYKPWYHLAIVDNVVLAYVWDTREIMDAFMLADLKPSFDTIKITDSGKALFIGPNSSDRAKQFATMLKQKYADLPMVIGDTKLTLQSIKDKVDEALLDVNEDIFDIHDDAQIVFIDKSCPIPDNLYMYKEAVAINPDKRKFIDSNAYAGMAKYFAIQARCAILSEWSNLIKSSK